MEFPQYRKYPNGKSFFKIVSNSTFEEINFIGKKAILRQFEAKILPDRNLIMDMLEMREVFWVECEAKTFENLKAEINSAS